MDEHKTDKDYWEHFWSNIELPCRINQKFSNDWIIATTLKNTIPSGKGEKQALEIGCAPGKWLIFLYEELNYIPEGCEYLESAARTTRKNLEICNLSSTDVIVGDFLNADFTNKTYDLIVSLGFIEHFTDPYIPIQKMLSLLSDDGYLVIGIPKFTGLNYYISRYIDKKLDHKILPSHNLGIMNIKFFTNLVHILRLNPVFISYVGGFEPALFDISKTPWWFKKIFWIISTILRTSIVNSINLSFWSGYIMAIYHKNGGFNEASN